LHDYYLLCPRSTMFRNGENCEQVCLGCRPYALLRRHLSSRVDALVGDSRFVLERHLRFGYFGATPKQGVIYPTYRAGSTTPLSETRSWPIRFGYLGQIVAAKGLEVLLKAVVRLPEGSWSLDVAGRGPAAYERQLRARYEVPAIRFLGYVRRLEVFFPEIDVLVVPSVWNDPSPRVISEAYAYGVPVVGSKRGGIPESIEEGHTGFLFDPDRPEDLTVKMRRYVHKPDIVTRMRLACLRKAKSVSLEGAIDQYLEVYANT
jgi:glycosyltransferase involved in cell wall biosynthesis